MDSFFSFTNKKQKKQNTVFYFLFKLLKLAGHANLAHLRTTVKVQPEELKCRTQMNDFNKFQLSATDYAQDQFF